MAEETYTGAAPRVALLARPGKAADNLTDALREAGAELVLLADPSSLDEASLQAANAEAVLVALEPGVESAIEALDEVLSSSGLTVIFDEAETAAQRAGWDAARWIRHLSAKLRRHGDVLPPGGESDQDWHPKPGQLPNPDDAVADLDMALFAKEAVARAGSVPADPLLTESQPATPAMLDAKSVVTEAITAIEIADDVKAQPDSAQGKQDWSEIAFEFEPVEQHVSAASSVELSVEPSVDADAASVTAEAVAFAGAAIATTAVAATDIVEAPEASIADAGSAPMMAADHEEAQFEQISLEAADIETAGIEMADSDTLNIESFDLDAVDMEFAHSEDVRAEGVEAEVLDVAPLMFEDDMVLANDAVQSERIQAAAAAEDSSFELSDADVELEWTPRTMPATEVVPTLDELIANDATRNSIEPDLDTTAGAQSTAVQAPGAPDQVETHVDVAPARVSFGELSLVEEDAAVEAAPVASTRITGNHDLSALEARISSLSLVDIDDAARVDDAAAPLQPAPSAQPAAVPPPLPNNLALEEVQEAARTPIDETPVSVPPPLPVAPARSAAAKDVAAVLVEAGLGGPDPVRQLLAALPANFPLPVLVRLHLQGGRYDRLVAQMERASSMPVALAEAGLALRQGTIYFVPDGLMVTRQSGAATFVDGDTHIEALFAALSPADSALVFLSGSDPSLIDTAMAAASAGALTLAQVPEDCYDGIACGVLRSRGVALALPADLAARLASRWTGDPT